MASAAYVKKLFSAFESMRVMIVGDVMVDKYVFGTADRISPEAPVPVVDVKNADARPGGAANVAVNVKALGATPYLFSVTGNDHDAWLLQELLSEYNIAAKHMIQADERITTSKMRVFARQHQMLRIDHEQTDDLLPETAKSLEKNILNFIRKQKPDCVILEDYDKGVLSDSLIKQIIQACNEAEIPVAVDPKKQHFFSYAGCTLFKPNLRELRESLSGSPEEISAATLQVAVKALKQLLPHELTLLTLGEYGMYAHFAKSSVHEKAHVRDIADVSGAGDTVISVAALCLAAGADAKTLVHISNLAGGLVCESSGVVPIDKARLLKEATKK